MESIRVAAIIENLPEVQRFVAGFSKRVGLSQKGLSSAQVAVEEVFVNVCSYSYAGRDRAGEVEIEAARSGGGVAIAIYDDGEPFDAAALPDPDIGAGIEERKVGGLGIFMARNLTRDFSCGREGGRNVTRFSVM